MSDRGSRATVTSTRLIMSLTDDEIVTGWRTYSGREGGWRAAGGAQGEKRKMRMLVVVMTGVRES